MRARRIGYVAIVGATLALGLGACGGGDSQASAEEGLCDDLATFSAAVTGLQGLNPQTTKGDWEAQTQAVQNSWEAVESSAQGVAQADTAALESSVSDLQNAISDVPDDATFEQAAQDIQPQLSQLAQVWSQAWNGLDCAATGASTTDS